LFDFSDRFDRYFDDPYIQVRVNSLSVCLSLSLSLSLSLTFSLSLTLSLSLSLSNRGSTHIRGKSRKGGLSSENVDGRHQDGFAVSFCQVRVSVMVVNILTPL
jgi:hypothetical protein